MTSPVHVSVNICTLNRADQLERTLTAFTRLIVPPDLSWEMVIVNNHSAIEADRVAAAFQGRLPIRLYHEPVQGISRARNTALRHCRGELLVLTDDDVEVPPTWLTRYWAAYQAFPGCHFFGGGIISDYDRPEHGIPGYIQWAPPSVRGFEPYRKDTVTSIDFLGANWAAPRAAIIAAGGFDPDLGQHNGAPRVGEETELMRRLRADGWRGVYLAEQSVRHRVPREKMRIRHIVRRFLASGYCAGRRPHNEKKYLGLVTPSALCRLGRDTGAIFSSISRGKGPWRSLFACAFDYGFLAGQVSQRRTQSRHHSNRIHLKETVYE